MGAITLTYLRDANEFPVRTPAGAFEELRYLSCLSGPSLTDDYGHRVVLDDVEKTLSMFGDRQ